MRKTRNSLFLSIVSLLLCASMLVGTTFAWFTDGVSTGANVIAAGNLDVELDYMDANGNWQPVSEETELFDKDALWEPGYTEVVYLRVRNEGSLALKYQLGVRVASEIGSVNVNGDAFKLSDYIYFGAIDDVDTKFADRAAARAEVTAPKLISAGHTKNGTMEKGAQPQYMTLVVYMPESVDNAANYAVGEVQPRIQLGVELVATQMESELDSFGSDYDAAAGFPEINLPDGGKTTVDVQNGTTTADATISGDAVSATVPSGVAVNAGATELELSVTEMAATGSNITLADDEIMKPVDVHVEGVSASNTTPIAVLLKGFAPKGLNAGNLKLYHVEGGKTNPMTHVAVATPAHNEFTYDPATGDVTLYLATFSEITSVASTTNAWNGEFDYSWYTGAVALAEGESTADYVIANADQLAAFGAIVGGMDGQTQDSFTGKTVKLTADVNLGDDEKNNVADKIFYPIGYYNSDGTYEKTNTAITSGFKIFEGTFDGAGHTIANFYQNTWEMKGDHDWYDAALQYYRDGMGLFGKVYGGTVKNLTIENFSSDGEIATTGCVAAYADCGATFENISIFNCNPRVYNVGNGGIVGCVGWYANDDHDEPVTFKNITVDNSNKISALWGSYDVACGGLVGQYYPTSGQSNAINNAGIYMENCHVAAQMDVYNDVCANYQYYAYRYTGILIGSVRENVTIDGHVYPNMGGITAKDCTVHFGTWNDYYYCELVDNTTASYTHDYQMSRLVEIKAINGTTITYLDGTTGTVPASGRANYVIVDYTKGHGTENATCYHFKDGGVWTHDMGGIQTGIDENGDGQDDLKEDKQHIYLEFNNLVTGYGWGVTSKGVGDMDGVKILDREEANSVTKFETKFTGDFLYRVGNQNTVSLGSLFAAKEGATINSSGVVVSIDKVDENTNVSGTFTANTSDWTQGTIQFSGTGPVKLTIQDYDYCKPTVLMLEVVDAKNITSATGTTSGGDMVLLCDINTSNYVNYWNCTLYGNGFTYSLKGAPTAYNSKQGHGVLITKNATLDNLVIVGDVYNSYGAYTTQDCYNAAVDVLGETIIQNCYISGCAAPVLARANATITNTTLYGGTVANLIIKSGKVTVENVTTANYDDGRSLVGMGIVIHSDATESTELVLNGTLTQYNFISESKVPSDTYAKNLHTAMFGDSCSKYHFGSSPNRYVNAGIVSLTALFNTEDITDNANTGYTGTPVTVSGVNGFVYSQLNTSGSVNNGYDKENDSHVATTQGTVAPACSFDYTTKNYQAKQDGSNDHCYEENGTVYISMDEGDTFNWDTSILTATKTGQTLDYTVSMNGTDYTGESIAFNTAGDYTVEYTYTDNDNYAIDEDGNITTYSKVYTSYVHVNVSVVKAAWKNAEIIIKNTAMSGIYVMSGDYDYSYKMKFLDCITITDYDEAGDATTVTLSDGIASTSFIDVNNANPGKFDANNGTITITYSSGKVLTVSVGAWSGSGPSTKTCSVKTDDGVYLITDGASNAANTGVTWKITGYTYTGNNGAVVSDNTVVTFTWDTNSEGYNSKDSGCVTPDTLVTLADGSQVRVDSLKGDEELLVWNMETGKLDYAPILFVDNDPAAEQEIIHLYFSDGTDVKVIYEHGFWDYSLNKYVYLDANAKQYVGHTFAKQDGDKLTKVQLIAVVLEEEDTSAWSPVTEGHLCYFVNGMLSMPGGVSGLFNIFDVDAETMSYDKVAMERDIAKYGLFTYEELNAIAPLSREMFEAAGGAYLKISIGKGNLTVDELIYMINRYSKFFN